MRRNIITASGVSSQYIMQFKKKITLLKRYIPKRLHAEYIAIWGK